MAQDSLQCLAQLASLHGPIFPDEGSQVDYLAHFIEGLLNTINGQVYLPFITEEGTFSFFFMFNIRGEKETSNFFPCLYFEVYLYG